MLYLEITNKSQMIAIPRSDGHAKTPGAMTLTLSRGGRQFVFGELLDEGVNSLNYLLTVEDTSGLSVGEYDYTLTDYDGEEASVGIAVAGEYKRDTTGINGNRKIVEYGG